MKKGIRATALGLTIASVFALSGITSTAATSTSNKSPVTWTVWTDMTGTALSPNNKMAKVIKKDFGVTLKTEMLVGDKNTKIGTMNAGGVYDDLLFYDDKFVTAGALIPLEKYLTSDKYPNLKKHYAAYLTKMKDPEHSNHIYYMPNWNVTTGTLNNFEPNGTAFWIQKKVLRDAGYPKITTPAQYFSVIEAYQKKHPTTDGGKKTIGFEILADTNRMYSLINAPEFLAGYPNDGDVIVNKSGSSYKASIFLDTASSKNYFQLLNQEYLKGVVDKETFTQNYDQYISKISNGQVLGLNDQEWSFDTAVQALKSNKQYWDTYVGLPLTWTGKGDQYIDRPDASINLLNGYGISRTCKDPDRVMKFLNDMLDPKYQILNQWGVKGTDYEVDKKGHFYRTPAQRAAQNDQNWVWNNTLKAFSDQAPKLQGTYSDGNATSANVQTSEWQANLNVAEKAVLKAYKASSFQNLYSKPKKQPLYYPCWQISVPSSSAAFTERQKLYDLALEYLPQCVSAAKGSCSSIWNTYYSEMHKTDINAFLKVENDGIQYRLKTWGKK
jgi:putative aldouronate transport system substrate-binding protein